jgi:ADP-heptose:LPS heptosyltransferase
MKRPAGTALISAASGIGDIIRVTPLIRVVHQLGYNVDVLLSPDDPAAADLVRGAAEVRDVFVYPRAPCDENASCIAGLRQRQYDIATFTTLSAQLGRFVNAARRYSFGASWRVEGDAASVEKLARSIGWRELLPGPFVVKSSRYFDLSAGTVALHPGCKPNWPWKKWHGFDELAGHFPNVVVVGTAAGLDNSRTYFVHPFMWPEHVRDFTGQLDLLDTAALLSQCAALISVDSGVMHLGVALGIPTFGIFGITNPQRECMPSPLMIPISKKLPCEPACRNARWGRRDCEYHLACLKTLSAEEVAAQVAAVLG